MNYGETLAIWYFRLNGFFSLRDFVLHRSEGLPHTSDCDVLAIRFPHVFEEIGGQPEDWDVAQFEAWGLDLNRPLVVIAQVKTGRARSPQGAFSDTKIRQALQRVGLWRRTDVGPIVQALHGAAFYGDSSVQIAKVLVATDPEEQVDAYQTLRLCDALAFMRRRFEKYRAIKEADRLYFPDELIQFLASEEGKA